MEEVIHIAQKMGAGQHRVLCPNCAPDRRKKTIRDLALKVDDDGATYFCHHCQISGAVQLETKPVRRKQPVVRADIEEGQVSDKLFSFMQARGISQTTVEYCGVRQSHRWFRKLKAEDDCVMFTYCDRNHKPYAAKLRALNLKDFSAEGAPQSLWLADRITNWEELVICEGEIDAMSCVEAGISGAVSIPNGAINPPKEGENRPEPPMSYIGNHADALGKADRIVLALDNDAPGRYTTSLLARRLGKDKCWVVHWPEGIKDANEMLLQRGAQALREAIENAAPYPIEGAVSDKDALEDARLMRERGFPEGAKTGLREFDELYSAPEGRLTVVTGHPGSGKSQFLDQIMVNLAEREGWTFGIVGFENDVGSHLNELMHMWLGKSVYPGKYGQCTEYEEQRAERFISKHFKWMNTDGDKLPTLQAIMEMIKSWVRRFGIRGIVIDPFNYIARDKDTNETDWISTMLSAIKLLCKTHGLHIWFVAHPTKMKANADDELPVPTGYDISGSAAWYSKADMGLTVHRPEAGSEGEKTELHIWKAKRRWMGRLGSCEVWYSPHHHQYCCIGEPPRVRELVDPTPPPF